MFQLCSTLKTFAANKSAVAQAPPAPAPKQLSISDSEAKRLNFAQTLLDQMLDISDDMLDDLRCDATLLFRRYQKLNPSQKQFCDFTTQVDPDDFPLEFPDLSTTQQPTATVYVGPEYAAQLRKFAQMHMPMDCATAPVTPSSECNKIKQFTDITHAFYGGTKQINLPDNVVSATIPE